MEETSKWIIKLKHQHKDLLTINQMYFQTLGAKHENATVDN